MKALLSLIAYIVVVGCSPEQAVFCLETRQPLVVQDIVDMRIASGRIAEELGAELVDVSEDGSTAIRIRLIVDRSDMTIMSFGSNSPLICFYGDPQDPDAHRLINESLRQLSPRFDLRIASSAKAALLPDELRTEIDAFLD